MTVKKFDTIPAINTSGGPSSEAINWHNGSLIYNTRDTVISYGSPQTWERDLNWTISGWGKLHEQDSFTMSGKNGKDHEANYEQNISGWGQFPLMKFVAGFSIDFKQDSTAGHGIYLRNAGIEFATADGTRLNWGSNDRSRQNDYNRHTVTYRFSAADRAAMSTGGSRFTRFICRLSSRGGTGDRTTQLTLGSFRLLYDETGVNDSSVRWILPNEREYNKRNDVDILIR